MSTLRPMRPGAGFSLLEVLIAVVVLSVGLLALAALQGSLTRASAEAKVRGRVAAALAARMDELRNQGYGSLPEGVTAFTSTDADDCDPATPDATDWLDCARNQAALASLTGTQAIATWYGAGSFTTPAPASQDPTVAQFRRISLTATWDDAAGSAHQLGLTSDVSAMALTSNLVPPPEAQSVGGGGPIVRTVNPATAGVIPIAMGTDETSATSNPVPELVGQRNNMQVVGTRFTVLNYTPPANGMVVIQKRFENEVVKCSCKYGAGGSNLPLIYRTAQWPAIWTGERYDVYAPSPLASAPGQALASGPRPGATQSPLCQECCRDHHDTQASTVRFDPERPDSEGVAKFDADASGNLSPVTDTSGGTYVDACRLIRVDGFWRTAADMYARQFGLLETRAVNGVAAKSGLPTDAAVATYTSFVRGFLALYDGSSASRTDGQSQFENTSGIDLPATIAIDQPSNSDYRYLHGRGLYVDHLEEQARNKLSEVLADTGPQGRCPTGAQAADCVMPYLPFTTANLTEIAQWQASDSGILTVNSGNLLATDPAQPSGGRTIGTAVGSAENRTSMRPSNSGIAVNAVLANVTAVDVDDANPAKMLGDHQAFAVGGDANAGPAFDVRVGGGGANPFVFFTLGAEVDRECLKPAGGDHHCVTSVGTVLPQAGTVRIANYWIETTTSQRITTTCNGTTATDTVAVPTFRNFEVVAASIGGVPGTIAAPVDDNKATESTGVAFGAIAANDLVQLTLAEQAGSPSYATVASCSTNPAGNKINNIVWTRPWTQP